MAAAESLRELSHCRGNVVCRACEVARAAADLLDAIDVLHRPDAWPVPWCLSCFVEYPCPTARLLHPEEADRG